MTPNHPHVSAYVSRLTRAISMPAMQESLTLSNWMKTAWVQGNVVYFCGNGGSAGNAIHLANDFTYGVGKKSGKGIRVEALSANASVITCLANDVGYDHIFSEQLKVKANPGDILVALSGSGNSPNVLEALKTGNALGMRTCAILGYSGGQAKKIAQLPIHFEIDDMQISEDLQLVVGHICMQYLVDGLVGLPVGEVHHV